MLNCICGLKWPDKGDVIGHFEKDLIQKIKFPLQVDNCCAQGVRKFEEQQEL